MRTTHGLETRLRVAWCFAGLLIAIVVTGCTSDPEVTATESPVTTAPTTTAVEQESEGEPASTTTAGEDESPLLQADDDGWFPWLFPSPTLSWYEEGCPEPIDVAENFMANFLDDPTVELSPLPESTAGEPRLLAHNRGEGGGSLDSGTILTFAQAAIGFVECDAWVLISARSETIGIDEVDFMTAQYTDPDIDEVIMSVSGYGTGFEALIDIRVHDESFRTVAEGFAHGGNFEVEPFGGAARFIETPIDTNLLVIASGSNPADGASSPFAAWKARCCGGLDLEVVEPENGPPFAVVGVAFDDTLNVRSNPGVDSPVVGTLSPFTIGMQLLGDEPVSIGETEWVKIADIRGEGIEGWVSSRFITRVEGDASASILTQAFAVREALSLNAPVERLADVLAGANQQEPVVVSTDTFIADEDPLLTITDLDPRNTQILRWGFSDGEGSPIDATVQDFFAGYAASPALTETERVVVGQRTKTSNTIDNVERTFPEATIIEFHYSGGEGDAADFEWETLRLAFVPGEVGFQLVAIVTDKWTI